MSTAKTDKASDYGNPVSATLNGIADLFRKKPRIGELTAQDRLDGQTCLVTGANSGLGRATAIELARRGARVILACRSGIPEAGEEIKRVSGSDSVEMVKLDLADVNSIDACCDELRKREITLDRVVLNAGVVPRTPARTQQGYEMMFGVHYLGNRHLVTRLLADGSLPNNTFAREPNGRPHNTPRIVFVSSETHRTGTPIDFNTLGEFVDYGVMQSISQYGHSKLAMTAYAWELSRRLSADSGPDVAVHAVCPGPINSNIARDAPALFRPLLSAMMGAFFASPEKAAEPVVYLTCAPALEGQTGVYLHLMTRKDPAPQAMDLELGARLWEQGPQLPA